MSAVALSVTEEDLEQCVRVEERERRAGGESRAVLLRTEAHQPPLTCGFREQAFEVPTPGTNFIRRRE